MIHHISVSSLCSILTCILFLAGCAKQNINTKQKNTISQEVSQDHTVTKTHDQIYSDIEEYIDRLYGSNGANLTLDQIFFIQDLCRALASAHDQERNIAGAVITMLQEHDAKTDIDNPIHDYLIKYLQGCMTTSNDHKTMQTDEITKIAKDIIEYSKLEQQYIFSNEKTKHIFLSMIDRQTQSMNEDSSDQTMHSLPKLINFWSTPEGQHRMMNLSISDQAQIQVWFTWTDVGVVALEMAIGMAAMQGASLANAQLTNQGRMLAEMINKNSQTIQTSMQAFQQSAQKQQQKQMQAMIAAFGKSQQNLQEQTAQAGAVSSAELDYLYQNISLEKPQQNFIFNQIQYDQLFSLGTMSTPQGPVWKNPFASGDWGYDQSTKSFWQYQIAPVYNQITDDAGATTSSSLQAENNAIFAEYCTHKQTYTIAGSITLYNVQFPFFAGIMFNKARWISGDFESIRKCRMLGIYGDSNKNIGIYFAQQYTMTDGQVQATQADSPIQTPLQQILQGQIKPSIILPEETFATLTTAPVTINFTLKNSPTSVTFTFSSVAGASKEITINKLDPSLFMYHGIGFISPGAIAQFSLQQPIDFIPSQQALADYKG